MSRLRGVTLSFRGTLLYAVDAESDTEAVAKARRELARVIGVAAAEEATVEKVEPSDEENR